MEYITKETVQEIVIQKKGRRTKNYSIAPTRFCLLQCSDPSARTGYEAKSRSRREITPKSCHLIAVVFVAVVVIALHPLPRLYLRSLATYSFPLSYSYFQPHPCINTPPSPRSRSNHLHEIASSLRKSFS